MIKDTPREIIFDPMAGFIVRIMDKIHIPMPDSKNARLCLANKSITITYL